MALLNITTLPEIKDCKDLEFRASNAYINISSEDIRISELYIYSEDCLVNFLASTVDYRASQNQLKISQIQIIDGIYL